MDKNIQKKYFNNIFVLSSKDTERIDKEYVGTKVPFPVVPSTTPKKK